MALKLPPRKASYTGLELARIVVWVGFRGTAAARAVAIILAESGGRTKATNRNGPTRGCPNGSTDRGLAQINDCYHDEVSDTCAYDPYCNVSAMWRISDHGRSFGQWATFNNGAYRKFMDAAAEWVNQVQQAGGVGPEIPPAAPRQGKPSTLAQALDWVLGPLNWGPLGWLRGHIKAAVLAGGHYVYDKLRPLIHDVGVAAGHALRLIATLRRWARQGFADVRAWAHSGFVTLGKAISHGLGALKSWTVARLGDAYTWARQEIWAPLHRALESTVAWVKTSVVPFFQRALASLAHALARVRDFLLGLVREVRQWAEHAVDWLLDKASGAIGWVARFGARVWWIVDHTWDFLFFVATHPFSWWRDLAETFTQRGAAWFVGQISSAVLREIDVVEELVVRWFGK